MSFNRPLAMRIYAAVSPFYPLRAPPGAVLALVARSNEIGGG